MRDIYFPQHFAPSHRHETPDGEKAAGPPITWADILECWVAVELDLHEVWGIDVETGILQDRTWRWLALRIRDLIDRRPDQPGHRLATRLRQTPR